MWITDPKSKEPSVTLTLFVIGFIVCVGKLALSGLTFGSFNLSQFSGVDFGAAVGALGGIYALRRNQDEKGSNEG